MKKLFVTLFLVTIFTIPALARDMELIPKLGFLFSPELTQRPGGKSISTSKDSAVSLGGELFLDMDKNFFLGIGIMYGQIHKFTGNSSNKIGFSNIYVELKRKFLVNNLNDNSLFIYPLIQVGYGIPDWKYNGYQIGYKIEGQFYWGLGVGCEYRNVIFELIYGCNYAAEKYITTDIKNFNNNLTYTAFRINVGYKFNL